MIYQAILHTGNRTGEQKEFGQAIDGIKAVIADSFDGKGYFILFPLDEESETKFAKVIYDEFADEYESFESFKEDFDNGEIYPNGYFTVGKDEVEITGQFKMDL